MTIEKILVSIMPYNTTAIVGKNWILSRKRASKAKYQVHFVYVLILMSSNDIVVISNHQLLSVTVKHDVINAHIIT